MMCWKCKDRQSDNCFYKIRKTKQELFNKNEEQIKPCSKQKKNIAINRKKIFSCRCFKISDSSFHANNH